MGWGWRTKTTPTRRPRGAGDAEEAGRFRRKICAARVAPPPAAMIMMRDDGARALVRVGITRGRRCSGGRLEGNTPRRCRGQRAHRLEQAAPAGRPSSLTTLTVTARVFDVRSWSWQASAAAPGRCALRRRAPKPRAFRLRTRGSGRRDAHGRAAGRARRLRDALQTVVEDGAQALTVVGDAGIGKSRLLYEFSSEVELLPGG